VAWHTQVYWKNEYFPSENHSGEFNHGWASLLQKRNACMNYSWTMHARLYFLLNNRLSAVLVVYTRVQVFNMSDSYNGSSSIVTMRSLVHITMVHAASSQYRRKREIERDDT
jgi:hypothetical protein